MTPEEPSALPWRRLGRTGVSVTALGFGAAAIGNLYQAVSDAVARQTVATVLQMGVRFVDTAPHYGFGLSEMRLGAALADLDPRQDIIVSTKVGRLLAPTPDADLSVPRHGFVSPQPFEPVFDYTYDGVMRSYESSLQRLRRSHIDILLAHDLGRVTHGAEHERHWRDFLTGGYKAMRELRDGGAVGVIGLGVNEWEICEAALAEGEFDCFLLAGRYTLLEQSALDRFLPLCAARGVSLILGGPFNSGILAAGVKGAGPFHYNYEAAPPQIVARVARIEQLCDDFGVALAAAALQFPLAHPQISAVIPGMADPGQARQAAEWLRVNIPAAFWQALRDADLLHPAAPLPKGVMEK
jgi:D-threo-aldose 1-dehydrogenase